MKTSELITLLQKEVEKNGDQNVVIAANKHSYYGVRPVTKDNLTTLALFDKVED
ncbi:MAG: hypothetical protein MJY67_01670 [Bacteroidales bacterium]|nr:hypothetical protein [Bacteroidales bacterium]